MKLTLEQQHMLSYAGNTMRTDVLATLGARASAGMVLQSRNIPSTASEELTIKFVINIVIDLPFFFFFS